MAHPILSEETGKLIRKEREKNIESDKEKHHRLFENVPSLSTTR
jgi:hypothetical protein